MYEIVILSSNRTKVRWFFRVLSVFRKSYDKWFMTNERIVWNKADAKANLKKHRAAITMAHEEAISGFQDNTISANGLLQHDYHWKNMCMVVNGTQIYDVAMDFFHH